jgi:hypothetical protein
MDTTTRWTRRALAALTILVTMAASGGCVHRSFAPAASASDKIDPAVLHALEGGATATLWVGFDGRPDLSGWAASVERQAVGVTTTPRSP